MSNGVDGSLVLGVRLSDEDVDAQARRIGEKVRAAIEGSLKNSDLLKVIKVEGAGKSQGEVYGNEFIDAYLRILKTGNAGLAKSFETTFQKVFARQGEDQAKKFITQFESVLNSRGEKIASQFTRSLSGSLDIGGKETGKRYVENFEKSFQGVAPRIVNDFQRIFQSVLSKSNASTAGLFSKSFAEVEKTSKDLAALFAQNFESVLKQSGSKSASEYAKGFTLAFSKQGQEGAREYSVNFLKGIQDGINKAEEAIRKAELTPKLAASKPVSTPNLNKVLETGGSTSAKTYDSTFQNLSKQSQTAADQFSDNFQKILNGSGPKSANEFAKGFEIAFKTGGDRDAKNYIQSFNQRLVNERIAAIKPEVVKEQAIKPSKSTFNNVLNQGNAGSARLFESTFSGIAKESVNAANQFSETFQRILSANGPKVANEFAKGFQASFSNGGQRSAEQFSSQFQGKLAEAARQAAANMKTTLETPTIPQGFVDAFSRILNKSGASTAQQFSKTWNQIYQMSGEKSANEFQKNFQAILNKRGDKNANNYAKDISVMYSNAGEKAGVEFVKNFKKYLKLDIKGILGDQMRGLGSFIKDTLTSALGNALSSGFTGIFNGIIGTIKGMFDGMLGGIKGSIEKFLNFDKQIATLKAISGGSPDQIQRVEKEIKTTAKDSPIKTDELATIATELNKAGVPLDAINSKILKSITLMAQLSGESAGRTTEIVNQIQSQFEVPMENTADTIDLIVAAANGAQTSVNGLGLGISYVGANATTLGVNLQDTVRALALLSNAGLEGTRGGTALANMLKDLSENSKTLSQLKINVFDEKGKVDLFNTIKQLKEATKDLSNEDQYKFLSGIFTERGIRGATGLMKALEDGNEKTAQLDEKLKNVTGSLEEAGSTLNDAVGSKLGILVNKVELLQIKFGEAFEPGLNALADFGNQTAEYLLENTGLFDSLNQANQEFADYLAQHPEYAQMLADIIAELSQELFEVLLDQTKDLLGYLKENPNAVKELAEGFKGFASSVINILPKVAKLVEMLYNAANYLGFINDNSDGGGDFEGGDAFASGLYTAPQSNNGGSADYHIDSKFARDLPFDRVIAAMDAMALAYEEQGRVIEFSNDAVGGQRYDVNDPNRGELIKKAFDAHSHSVSADFNSLDYYVPKKDKNRNHNNPDGTPSLDSGAGVEMMLPNMGGKVEYDTGGRYGNHAFLYDSSGKLVMKTGHGDDRKALPGNKSFISDSSDNTRSNSGNLIQQNIQTVKTVASGNTSLFDKAMAIGTGIVKNSLPGMMIQGAINSVRQNVDDGKKIISGNTSITDKLMTGGQMFLRNTTPGMIINSLVGGKEEPKRQTSKSENNSIKKSSKKSSNRSYSGSSRSSSSSSSGSSRRSTSSPRGMSEQGHVVIPLDHSRGNVPDKTGGNTFEATGQSGASYRGFTERDFQDPLASKAAAKLRQQGYKVTILRPEDFKSFEEYDNKIKDLSTQRNTVVTPLHLDARMSGYNGGYLTRSRSGDSDDNRLSNSIYKNMQSSVGNKASSKFVGQDTDGNATIKAAASAPATLVEFGAMADFVDRYGNAQKYVQSDEANRAIGGYVKGIDQFFGGNGSRGARNNNRGGGRSSSPSGDDFTGAVISILEAPSRQGRVDAAQVISNRVGTNHNGYGKNMRDQLFAQGQFQPTWRYGIGKNEIQNKDSAISALGKAGFSKEQAQKALSDFFNDISNPKMIQDSASKVGGRKYFKGISEYHAKRPEDFLRQDGENFYHHMPNDVNKNVVGIGSVFSSSTGGVSNKRSSKFPEYQKLNLLGESDPVRELIGLQDNEPSDFDKMRSKRDKEIEKLLAEQEKIEKQIAQETKKNAEESLKVKRDTFKEQREQDKRVLESAIAKKKVEFQGTEFSDSYETASRVALKRFDNSTELNEQLLILEDIDLKIKDIEENRGKEAGIDEVLTSYKEQKKVLEGIVEETKKVQAEEISNIQLADTSRLAIEKKKQAQEEFVKTFERQSKIQGLEQTLKLSEIDDSDFRSVLENSFKSDNLKTQQLIATQPIQFEIKKLQDEIKEAVGSGLDFTDSLELMRAKLQALEADLTAVNQEFKITGDTIQTESQKILKAKMDGLRESFQNSRSQFLQSSGNSTLDNQLNKTRAITAENERYKKSMNDLSLLKGIVPDEKLAEMTQLNADTNKANLDSARKQKGGYKDKLFESRVGSLKQRGFKFEAADMEQDKAKTDEFTRFREEMEILSSLKGKIPDEELENMMNSAKEINEINLGNISGQFETLGNTIKNTLTSELKGFAMKAITDFDNIGEAFDSLIDNMLNKALEMILDQAFAGIFGGGGNSGGGGLFGMIGGLFGGGGGGGGFGIDLDDSALPFFATGGMVANNGTSNYSDSILALLSPGEAVLSADKVRQLSGITAPSISPVGLSGGNQNIINTNVYVTMDGNGNVNSKTTGDMTELAPMIESMIVSRVSQMKFSPGGLLNE